MMALLLVEMRRILSRRAVYLAGGLVLVGMLTAGTVLFVRSHRVGPDDLRAREQKVQAIHRQLVAECAGGGFGIPQGEIPPGLTREQYCEQVVGTPEVDDPTFRLTSYRQVAEGLSGLFIALATILAASFIGAEWHAGTVTTQLTWEPRRNRVLVAKVIAGGLFAFAFFVLAQALLLGVLTPAGMVKGTTAGVNLTWFRGAAGVVLRGGVAAALMSAIAFAVASIARNTAASLGVVFVYVSLVEPLVRAARPRWQRWFLYDNLATLISGRRLDFTTFGRSVGGAALMVSIYSVVFVLAAMAVFRRRDVT